MNKSTDSKRGVARVGSVQELPAQSLLCLVNGHAWSDPPLIARGGWGQNVDAGEFKFICPCGRWKREVIDCDTGEILTREYGGGTMLFVQEFRAVVRAEWARRKRARMSAKKTAKKQRAAAE